MKPQTRAKIASPPCTLSPLVITISSVFMALSTPAYAQDTDDTASFQLDTLNVWGVEVNSSSEWVGEESISVKQPDHMSDLLRDIPGVDVGGTHSVNQRINIRGLNETDLDIRLDGASQQAKMFHHIGNLTLNPDIIKAVDIEVGSNSVTSDGVGGSVYFETKNANDLLQSGDKVGARVHASYGSNSYTQGSITAYGKPTDSTDVMLYGVNTSRNNFEDGQGVETFGAEGTVKNGLVKFGWEPTDEQRIQVSYDVYQDKGDYNPRPDMSGDANQYFAEGQLVPTEYKRDTIALNYELDKGDPLYVKANVYRNHSELARDESVITGNWPSNRHSYNTAENTNTGTLITAQTRVAGGGLDHQLTYGLDINQQSSESQYGTAYGMAEELLKKAVFLEDRIALTQSLSITPGLRYTHVNRDASTSDTSFSDLTWALAADYRVTDALTVFASTRELFKAPELLESFVAYQDTTFLADDIRAESGFNSEIGARYNTHIKDHGFGGSLTVFRTDIDDHIAEVYSSDLAGYEIYNEGDVRLQGFELSVNYSYQDFSGKFGYSRVKSTNRTDGGPMLDANGRSTDLGDALSLNLDYDLRAYNLRLGWGSIWVLEEDNVLAGAPAKAAYDIHSLYAQWAPKRVDGLLLTFGIDNVFDELYVSHASRTGLARGYTTDDYEPGRNIKASVSYQF